MRQMSFCSVLTVAAAAVLAGASVAPATPVVPVTGNLVTHFDAAVGTYVDNGVTPASHGQMVQWWDDQATALAGNNAAQQATAKPTLQTDVLNGLPVLRFGGAENLLVLRAGAGGSSDPMGTSLDTNTLSWFVVVNKASPAATQSVLRARTVEGGDNRWGTFYENGQYVSHSRTAGGGMVGSGMTTPTDTFVVLSSVWDGSHANSTVQEWINGVAGPIATGATQTGTFDRFRIGNGSSGGSGLNGDIAEVLVYNAALSDADRRAVEDYLNAKYFAAPTDAPATAGLLVHFDGSSASTNANGKVAAWHNRAGMQHTAMQTSEARMPDLIPGALNGHNVLRFDGDNANAALRDYLDIAGSSDFDTDTLTWFIVAAPEHSGGADVLLRSAYSSGAAGNSNRMWSTFTENGNLTSHARSSTGGFHAAGTSTTPGEFVLMTAQWGADDTVRQFINGGLIGTSTGANAVPSGHQFTRIGATTEALDQFFAGDMAEVLIYNQALSNPDRRNVEDYLYTKYFTTGPPRLADVPLVNNLRLHATLNTPDIVGSTVLDTAGTPQNGTIVGTNVQNPAGILGQALRFNGSDNDYVSFGNVLDPGPDGYTVSLWFNPDTTSGARFLAGKGNPGSGDVGWSIWTDGSTLHVRGQQNGGGGGDRFGQFIPGEVTAGQWHHVALVLDRENDTIRGYLNGSNDDWLTGGGGSQTDSLVPGSLIETAAPLLLGRRQTGGAPFAGLIDDFAIWDRALSPSEITYLYAKGLIGFDAAAVPEPTSLLLLAIGAAALLLRRRRR